MENNQEIIRLENVSKTFDLRYHKTLRAVDNVSLSLHKGICTAIVGESGCGKSTLARMVTLLEPVTDGMIYYKNEPIGGMQNGRNIALRGEKLREYRRNVQMIFQDPANVFSPRMKIGTFLMEPWIHFEKKSKKEAREMAYYSLKRVYLGEEYFDKYPHQLSGGELQRVLLAMALELKANAADLADCEVQAIRLGGGSASIINGSDLDHLLRLIRSCYHVAEDAPVTMRTCPADINGANMPFYNRSHVTRYDLELYSLEPLDFCTLDTLNYSEQMPYITHGFLRADRRDSMGFVLLYGKKTVSRWGFRHSVLEVTRRPVCHVLLQRCAGADMLDDAEAQAQLDEAAQLLTEAGFVQYLPRRWAKPGCEDKFWQGAANGMDVLAFGLSAYTRLDGMITTNTSDLNTYLAHSADYEQITVSTVPVQTAE